MAKSTPVRWPCLATPLLLLLLMLLCCLWRVNDSGCINKLFIATDCLQNWPDTICSHPLQKAEQQKNSLHVVLLQSLVKGMCTVKWHFKGAPLLTVLKAAGLFCVLLPCCRLLILSAPHQILISLIQKITKKQNNITRGPLIKKPAKIFPC